MGRADKKFKAIKSVVSLLSEDSTIKSLVGSKIYSLIAPQDVKGDFIVLRRDGYARQDTKMGVSLQQSIFYVIAVSEDYDRSLDLAEAAYDSLEGDHSQVGLRIRIEDYAEEYVDQKFIQVLRFNVE